MIKFNLITTLLSIIILVILVWIVISINNLNTKIDKNQERILNNQNAIYQNTKK
jgi:hypothetical protein